LIQNQFYKMKYFFSFLFLSFSCLSGAQGIVGPAQPLDGPGSTNYAHDSVQVFDYAQEADGFWLYQPAAPRPDSAHLVVFVHGYGAYNPMIYGDWIKHLVQQGNLVLFPRYQKNLFSPAAVDFIPNVATAIKDAIHVIDSLDQVKAITSDLALVGHSYGGVISAGLGVQYKSHGIPKPEILMLCSPGSGPLRGGVLSDYSGISADTKLLVMISEHDRIVGDKLGVKIFEMATAVEDRNLVRQLEDEHGSIPIEAGHNESYSINPEFDNGVRNITARRAENSSSLDAVDYYGYWKIFDALLDCVRSGQHCTFALGDTAAQRYMGEWSDGTPVKELEITLPDKKNLVEK